MKYFFYFLHMYLFLPLFNLLPCIWIRIFYDNYTYLSNALGHHGLVIGWAFFTVIGFYVYSVEIWKSIHFNFSKGIHKISCIGLFLVSFIPYSETSSTLWNDLHVWTFVVCFILFFGQWFFCYLQVLPIKKKKAGGLFIVLTICACTYLIIGHMSAFTEMIGSYMLNYYLYHNTKKVRKFRTYNS